MTTDEEPRIRRRAPEPEKPGLRSRQLHGINVTLDELEQIETIIRDYASSSPPPEYEHRTDHREVKISAGTADLPTIGLARALHRDELSQLNIAGYTNDFAVVRVYFESGGDVQIIWDSSSQPSVQAANLIESVLNRDKSRLTRRQMRTYATRLSYSPIIAYVVLLYLRALDVVPEWVFIPLIAFQLVAYYVSHRLQQRADTPTIKNRTNQELEDARRIPRGQKIAYAIGLVGIIVSLTIALTK